MIFAPQTSVVRNVCGRVPSWIKTILITPPTWSLELQKLEGHTHGVNAVAFSQDSSLLASVSTDQTIKLWNPVSGREIQTFNGHTSGVHAVSFLQDGSLLASASYDKTVRLWNSASGQEIQKLKGHISGIEAVAFSHDGSLLASASADQTIRLWNPVSGQEIQKLGDVGYNKTLIFTNDNKNLRFNHGTMLIGKDSLLVSTSELFSNQTLIIEGDWIRQGDYNLLWLPQEYRTNCSTFHNNTFAFGLDSGPVSFLKLDYYH